MNAITTANTMSSIELVSLINSIRKQENPTQAELCHKNFMAKIRKVLGESSAKFLAVYKDQQFIDRPCYHLPKREANLMVMSESYKVQAAVYDRMTELEQKPLAITAESLAHFLNLLNISDELKVQVVLQHLKPNLVSKPTTSNTPNLVSKPTTSNTPNLAQDFLQQVMDLDYCSGVEIKRGKLKVNLNRAFSCLPNENYWRNNRINITAGLQKLSNFEGHTTAVIQGVQMAVYIFSV